MKKDFTNWHKEKTVLEEAEKRVYFHPREVWWCHLGLNVGFEQDGKGEKFARPIVVFRKFNKELLWALPLTTKEKSGIFYVPVDLKDGIPRSAIISQVRLLDAKRLFEKFGTISEEEFETIRKAVIRLCTDDRFSV